MGSTENLEDLLENGSINNVAVESESIGGIPSHYEELSEALDQRPVLIDSSLGVDETVFELFPEHYVVEDGASNHFEDESVRHQYISSQKDLTGKGIAITDAFQDIESSYSEDPLIIYEDVSVTCQYNSIERIFQYFHVMTGKVSNIGGTALYEFNGTLDDQDYNTLLSLMDEKTSLEEL